MAGKPVPEAKPAKVLPRLMLAPLEPIELLYERLHEPSDDSPILYRERAYRVDALQSDDDLEEHLDAELSRIRRDWRHRDAPQFVQLSLYDHSFRVEPAFPPVATLSWKDWQGRSEICVRGVRRSTLPPGIPLDSLPPVPRPSRPSVAERRAIERARTSAPPDIAELPVFAPFERGAGSADDGVPPSSTELVASAERQPESPDDGAPTSRPDWQSPEHSGEYPIPLRDEPPGPPSSQRVLASDELVGAMFEPLCELAEVATLGAGADCVLRVLAEHIPCDGALIYLLELETEEFVILRALGPEPLDVVGGRTPGAGSHLSECLRRELTLELGQSEIARHRAAWQALGVLPRHVIASPLLRDERALGVIELCRTTSKGPFSAAQVCALEYACDRFAEFATERPVELAHASIDPPLPP